MSISTMETTRTTDLLTISIPLNDMNPEEIERFLDLIKSGLIMQRSVMTESAANEISQEIKLSWWENNGLRIKKMIGANE